MLYCGPLLDFNLYFKHLVSPVSGQVMWVCNQCRRQQDMLTKSGEWFPSQGPKSAELGSALSEPAMCGDPAGEKKLRSRSQNPLGSSVSTAHDTQSPAPTNPSKGPSTGIADALSSRSRSEPPQDRYTLTSLNQYLYYRKNALLY